MKQYLTMGQGGMCNPNLFYCLDKSKIVSTVFILCIQTDRPEQTKETQMRQHRRWCGVSSGSTLIQQFLNKTWGSKLYLLKF